MAFLKNLFNKSKELEPNQNVQYNNYSYDSYINFFDNLEPSSAFRENPDLSNQFSSDMQLLKNNTNTLKHFFSEEDLLYAKASRVFDAKTYSDYIIMTSDLYNKVQIFRDENGMIRPMVMDEKILQRFNSAIESTKQNFYLTQVDEQYNMVYNGLKNYSYDVLQELDKSFKLEQERALQRQQEHMLEVRNKVENQKRINTFAAVEGFGTENRPVQTLEIPDYQKMNYSPRDKYNDLKRNLDNQFMRNIDPFNKDNPYNNVSFEDYMRYTANLYKNDKYGLSDNAIYINYAAVDSKVIYPRFFEDASPEILSSIKTEKQYNQRSLDCQALTQILGTIREHLAAGGEFDFQNFRVEPLNIKNNGIQLVLYEGKEDDLNISIINCTPKENNLWNREVIQVDRSSAEYYAFSHMRQYSGKSFEGIREVNNPKNAYEAETIYIDNRRNKFTLGAEENKKRYFEALGNYNEMMKGNIVFSAEYNSRERAELELLADKNRVPIKDNSINISKDNSGISY